MPSPAEYNLIVTGDLVVDHHIYEGERHWPGQTSARGIVVERQLGGAELTHKLLAEIPKAVAVEKLEKKQAEAWAAVAARHPSRSISIRRSAKSNRRQISTE